MLLIESVVAFYFGIISWDMSGLPLNPDRREEGAETVSASDPKFINGEVALLWTGVECKAQHITERCYFVRVLGRSGWLGVVRSGDAIGPADGISAS